MARPGKQPPIDVKWSEPLAYYRRRERRHAGRGQADARTMDGRFQ